MVARGFGYAKNQQISRYVAGIERVGQCAVRIGRNTAIARQIGQLRRGGNRAHAMRRIRPLVAHENVQRDVLTRQYLGRCVHLDTEIHIAVVALCLEHSAPVGRQRRGKARDGEAAGEHESAQTAVGCSGFHRGP